MDNKYQIQTKDCGKVDCIGFEVVPHGVFFTLKDQIQYSEKGEPYLTEEVKGVINMGQVLYISPISAPNA